MAVTVVAQAAAAQSPDDFAAAARRGTERFRVLTDAIAEGYHALGPETPAMGQHWVQTRLLLKGSVEPGRPPILTYATIRGRPVLVGVAYAVPLALGQADPEPPVPGSAWHTHAASLAAEAHMVRHESHHSHGEGERVAVLHAWVWTANPDGVFEPDNWALPYARLGIPVPTRLDRDVARALSLAAGDSTFFVVQLELLTEGGPSDSAVTVSEVRAASRELADWRAKRDLAVGLAPEEESRLAARWRGLIGAIEARVSPRSRKRLQEAFPEVGEPR